jgi:CO/xanthine dehydrogenase FAD-binding subunit
MMHFDIVSPQTTAELLATVKKLKTKPFRFGAGYTDLMLELRKTETQGLTVVNLAHVRDNAFTGIQVLKNGQITLGGMCTAHMIVISEEIAVRFPVLHQAALNLASTQIRQVATVAGNLCTASPSGDIACALMALNADIELINADGNKRTVPIRKFFAGVRKTVMNKTEILYAVHIPANAKNTTECISYFEKVGTRKAMECSVVSVAVHLQITKSGEIGSIGIAMGAVAPTIATSSDAEKYLTGRNYLRLTDPERDIFCEKAVKNASPITDLRATAWYRLQTLRNIVRAITERK